VADATTAHSPIQAALHLDTLVLGSNVVPMRVFGHPRLNGSASGIRIEPAAGEALHVSVTVVNEGDAAARAVRVVVPPPPGFVAEESAIVASAAELPVGATLSFGYDMLPLGPAAAAVCIDDAFISHEGGTVALLTRATSLLAPHLVAPVIDGERRAGRLDLGVRVANDGWVAARDVRCALQFPPGWRILRGTMRADGAPATVRRGDESENGVAITLPLVPARGSVEVTLVASASRPHVEGDVIVRCDAHAVAYAIPAAGRRALHVDARPESAFAEPGTTVPVALDVHNTGETSERVDVLLAGESCWTGELRPGAAAACIARLRVPDDLTDGDVLTADVVANGSDGRTLASARFDLRTVDRPWIAVDDVVWDAGQTRVTIRNVGATVARNVRLEGATDSLVAALLPGDSQTVALSAEVARTASLVGTDGRTVPIGWDDQATPVAVAAKLHLATTVRAGERLEVRLQCTPSGLVQTLRIRPRASSGAPYVAGSTTVNGHAVVDGVDGPPLFTRDGLALHDIATGTLVDVAWWLLPRTPGDVTVAVELEANGVPVDVPAANVTIADAPPFGARPAALPFHIDAATVGDSGIAAPFTGETAAFPATAPPTTIDDLPRAPEPSAPEAWTLAPPDLPSVTLWTTLDAARSAAIVRVLRGARGTGLASHLPALAVLFPTGISTAEPQLEARFGATADVIRGIYERLFVKLRIPGYVLAPSDLEDAVSRRELLDVFGRIGATTEHADHAGRGDVYVRVDRTRALAVRAVLDGAPLGGAQALAAVAALLPHHGSDDAAAAVGAYVGELAATFETACALSQEAFLAGLMSQPTPELDEARDVAVAVLDAPNQLASP
jgi:hypothetical protein